MRFGTGSRITAASLNVRLHSPGGLAIDIRDAVQKLVAEIMAAWRRAERLANTMPADSAEHAAAQRACDRLRDAYMELTHSGVADQITAAEARLLLKDAASDITGA
jgi:hypothetical protein